jgi:hypothetical protein
MQRLEVSCAVRPNYWSLGAKGSILAIELGGGVGTTPRPLYPQEKPGTRCTEGWVGPRAGLG